MNPARLQQIQDLYHSVREREPGERGAFLEEACRGDEELRREVESLLAQNGSPAGPMQRPAISLLAKAMAAPVAAGDLLGSYKIESLLGEGGMGQVYQARDTRLGRAVAIKIANQQFSERFEREARAISSLNHSNICTLYDVGPNYLVMELVEGPTLADRIERGPIPLEEALAIAKQIADALEAAHEKGIVHRDLKPANIKIKPDGTVKVLDFGLAKVDMTHAAAQPVEASALTMEQATRAGVVLGTAPYMAPEQAKGLPVDKRADIWAFGVVLYEMLTGRRPFRGETLTDTLAAVIEREPDWSRAPAKARPLLRWCLEKDPKRRLHDIADAMPLLELTPEPVSPGGKSRLLPWFAVAIAAVVAVAAVFLYLREKASAVPPPQVRFRLQLPRGASFAVSPDGRQLAFTATGAGAAISRLWIQRLDSLESHMLPDTEGANGPPFWSPDSRFVAFNAQGKLRKIDFSGGTAQSICDFPGTFEGGSWSRDDVLLVGSTAGIMRIPASGGTLSLVVATQSQSAGEGVPIFLSDGRHFLYFEAARRDDFAGVYLGNLDVKAQDQPRRRLVATLFTPGYVPGDRAGSGHLLFLRDGSLLTQAFDEGRMQLEGEPVLLVDRVAGDLGEGFFTAARSGVLIYKPSASDNITQLTWYDRGGKALSTPGDPGSFTSMILSPDGKFASVTQADDVWIVDLVRSTNRRLTTSRALLQYAGAVWSPDGNYLAYGANPGGILGIYRRAVSGAGGEERLWKSDIAGPLVLHHWSNAGNYLLFVASDPKTALDLWMLPLKGDRKPFPWLQSEFDEVWGRFSPDDKWVAYRSNKSGKNEIYVQPFDPEKGASASGGETLVSRGGAAGMPRWRSDQKELYYLASDGKIMAVDVSTGPVFHAGEPAALFQTPPTFFRSAAPEVFGDVSADGKKFLLAMPVGDAGDPGFVVWLNWEASLRK
jgi:eukaryotic-like serine/threonine-protein kinase